MNPALPVLTIAVIVAAFVLGAFAPSTSAIPALAGQNARLNHPGEQILNAVKRLDPPPVRTEAIKPLPDWVMKDAAANRTAIPSTAISPDIADTFRKDLRAIVYESGAAHAVVGSQTTAQRKLAMGDLYRDEWRLQSITASEVLLRRNNQTRRVLVFAPGTPQAKLAANSPANKGSALPQAPSNSGSSDATPPAREWKRGDPRQMAPRRSRPRSESYDLSPHIR